MGLAPTGKRRLFTAHTRSRHRAEAFQIQAQGGPGSCIPPAKMSQRVSLSDGEGLLPSLCSDDPRTERTDQRVRQRLTHRVRDFVLRASQSGRSSTNATERLHEEFKRRFKILTVLPSAHTAAMLSWALRASGLNIIAQGRSLANARQNDHRSAQLTLPPETITLCRWRLRIPT